MKRLNMIGLGAIALLATIPFTGVMPGLASLQSRESAVAQTAKQESPVQLKLAAQRLTILAAASGQVDWKPLPTNASLRP